MAVGERIRYFRKRKKLTQKALGMFLGFKPKNAEVRIAQYETGNRTPRKKLRKGMSEALGIVPEAITVPDIDSFIGLMHTLFAIEDMYGLTVLTINGKPCLCMVKAAGLEEDSLHKYLEEWCTVKMDLLHDRISKEQYDDWRYNYPRIERKKADSTVTYTPLETVLD